MNILVMTLGKGKKENGSCYQTATYQFTDDQIFESSFFGRALCQWLGICGDTMDRVVILGTSGSSWDALLELEETPEGEDFYMDLGSAVEKQSVGQVLLDRLNPFASNVFKSQVFCRLIPDASTLDGQYDILSAIAQEVPPDARARLWMDLTHGFRSLPLLEVFSAFNLEEVKQVEVQGLYYGMLEKTAKGITPVVELSFAKELSQWTRALYAVERGQTSALIGLPGMEQFKVDLERLVLYEQMNQIGSARKYAKKILEGLSLQSLSNRAGELCRGKLIQLFRWSDGENYGLRQFQMAEKAMLQRDYVHGIILLNEVLITAEIPAGVDVQNYDVRKEAAENYCRTDDAHLLRGLRNTLAHGTRPAAGKSTATIMRLMDHPEEFHNEMFRLLEVVREEIFSNK